MPLSGSPFIPGEPGGQRVRQLAPTDMAASPWRDRGIASRVLLAPQATGDPGGRVVGTARRGPGLARPPFPRVVACAGRGQDGRG